MKKLHFSLFVLMYLLWLPLSAQWSTISVGTTQDLYSIDYYSPNDMWIGSFNQFVKTADGGASWTVVNPLKDLTSATIAPANIYDIAVTSPTTAVATGFFLLGNVEYTLRTTNGGANWAYATSLNTGGLPRFIGAVDIYSSRGMAVGNNGRFVRSTDGGATWAYITSVGSAVINDVKFGTFDTVYAAGDNKVYRSVSGGASGTWTSQSITGAFKSVACDHGVVYIGGTGTTMLKSVNYGTSYSPITLPFSCTGAVYAIDKDTVLAAGSDGLYVSNSGGQYWQKYILSGYQTVKMIDFLNNNTGMAVGLGGYALKTSNLSVAPRIPVSLFSIVGGLTTYCLGATINFTNTSEPGLTYTWQVNGTTFNTGFTPVSYTLNTEGTQNISLIVSNGYGSDTTTISVNVIGHTMTPLTYTASQDSVCTGTYVNFTLTGSQTGVNYQLRKNYTNIGSSQAGTGGALTFLNPTALTATNTYNIKAVRTTSCFTDSLVQNKTVYLVPASGGPVATCIPSPNLCTSEGITNVTFGSINNTTNTLSNNYFDYTCCKMTNVIEGSTIPISVTTYNSFGEYVKVWIDYNGDGAFDNTTELAFSGFGNPVATGNITIAPTFLFNQKLRMRVISDYDIDGLANACFMSSFYCGQTEDYSIIVLPAPVVPTASFTHAETVGCTTLSTFTNTSYNAVSYSWDFGDGSALSTLQNPTHTYSTSGSYTVTLTATNPTGSNSSSQTINITIPTVPVAAACTPITFPSYISPIYKFKIDTVNSPSGNYWESSYPLNGSNTCVNQINLVAGRTYYFSVNLSGSLCGRLGFWIDYNGNGIFDTYDYVNYFGSGYPVYSVCSSGYWPITVTIPTTGIAAGPLRLRVLTYDNSYDGFISNGCGSGVHGRYYDYTVFIAPPPPVTAAFSGAPTTVCANAPVTFTNNSVNATSYLWDFGDGATATSPGTISHAYTTAGVYSVKLKVWNSTSSDSLTYTNYITVNASPSVPVITLSGDTLSTAAVAANYQWYQSAVPIGGATTSSYVATLDGNYSVLVSNASGCSASSAVLAYFPPHVNFTSSPTAGCVPVTTLFSNTSTNCTSYTIDWGDGSPLFMYGGSGGPMHTYTVAGVYSMKLVGCGAMGCDSLTLTNYITANAIPATPLITFAAGQLSTAAGAATYQWYLSGGMIGGAVSNTYTPSVDGNYTVEITNAAGCSAISAVYAHFPVNANFTADTVGYCGVTTADVTFTNTSVNASSYSWDFGDGVTSTLASPTHTFVGAGTYTIRLIACGLSCDTLVYNNYIVIDGTPFSVNVTPTFAPAVCGGDSITMTGTSVAGVAYQWQYLGADISGATSNTYDAFDGGYYNLVSTNALGCIAISNTVYIAVDWNCVWPGDADYSFAVDNYDLLPIGLFYGQTGSPRNFVSNAWNSFPANDWGIFQSGGIDIKHVDCNGDGTIDANDTMAVNLNYTSMHALAPPSPTELVRSADPDLYCVTASPTYTAGDWVDVDIMAGTATEPVSNLYGIGFNLYFDNYLVEPGTASLVFTDSWLTDAATDGLSIGKIDMPASAAHAGVTRISHTSKDGYGKLATFRFQAATSITSTATMNFAVDEYYAIDEVGTALPFEYFINGSIDIDPAPLAIGQEASTVNGINVYPNPFTDGTTITYTLEKESEVSVEVFNAVGQKVETLVSGTQKAGNQTCVFAGKQNEHGAGVYFMKISIDGKTAMKRIVKMK